MLVSAYGRQWIPPFASDSFANILLHADALCMQGRLIEALSLYKSIESSNRTAARRLSIAKRQLGMLSSTVHPAEAYTLNLGFVDWYSGFEAEIHNILGYFGEAGYNPIICSPEESDILVAGCYGNRLILDSDLRQDKLVILIAGENIGPSYDIHDFSITTRRQSFCGKNVRLPQWHSEITFNGGSLLAKGGDGLSCYENKQRDYLISAIYNNSTPEREEILHRLRTEFGDDNVHVFGSQRTGQCNKLEILARSVINVCFENSIGDGYITEKLLHAKMMGCKALYWGDPGFSQDFLPDEVLNVFEAQSIETALRWCHDKIDRPEQEQQTFSGLNLNIFSHRPSRREVTTKLREWCKVVVNWRLPCLKNSANQCYDH